MTSFLLLTETALGNNLTVVEFFMKQISLFKILFLCVMTTIVGFLLFPRPGLFAATDHIVISEIQGAGATPSDEFIELYNPTSLPIVMTNWKIKKASSGGTLTTLSTFSGILPAQGFFLIANNGYTLTITPDIQYASTMGDNNTIYLVDDSGLTIDRVGMGIAFDPEGLSVAQPPASQSIERKAFASSTDISMTTGDDVVSGNGFDTDDNNNDFILRSTSDPQNSTSSPESPPTPTPTPTQEIIITPTPTYQLLPTPSGYTWGQIIRKGRSHYCTVWFQDLIRRTLFFPRPAFNCTQPVPITGG